jgi:hypothetical protein
VALATPLLSGVMGGGFIAWRLALFVLAYTLWKS